MRIYQWEEVAYRQAEVEQQLLHREVVKAALEAGGQEGRTSLSSALVGMVRALFTGLFAYGAESAKNCCTAEKRASAASF